MKRRLGLLIALASVLCVGVGSAAADYPVGTPALATSTASPTTGAPITLTASGWCANATVVFTSGGVTLGSATANPSGAATIAINAPASAGPFVVTASSSGACVASASVTMSVVPVVPGSTIQVRLEGFSPFEEVELTVFSTPVFLGTFTADKNGVVEAEVTLPAGLELGTHTITGVGQTSGVEVSIQIEIAQTAGGGGPGGPGSLPRTGSDSTISGLLLGSVAVGFGAALIGLAAVRRRRFAAS